MSNSPKKSKGATMRGCSTFARFGDLDFSRARAREGVFCGQIFPHMCARVHVHHVQKSILKEIITLFLDFGLDFHGLCRRPKKSLAFRLPTGYCGPASGKIREPGLAARIVGGCTAAPLRRFCCIQSMALPLGAVRETARSAGAYDRSANPRSALFAFARRAKPTPSLEAMP